MLIGDEERLRHRRVLPEYRLDRSRSTIPGVTEKRRCVRAHFSRALFASDAPRRESRRARAITAPLIAREPSAAIFASPRQCRQEQRENPDDYRQRGEPGVAGQQRRHETEVR